MRRQEHIWTAMGHAAGWLPLLPPLTFTIGPSGGEEGFQAGKGAEDRRLGVRRTWPLTSRKCSLGESLPVQASVSSSVQWGEDPPRQIL